MSSSYSVCFVQLFPALNNGEQHPVLVEALLGDSGGALGSWPMVPVPASKHGVDRNNISTLIVPAQTSSSAGRRTPWRL